MEYRPIRPERNQPVALATLVESCGLVLDRGASSQTVTGVTLSDSQVLPGDLFVGLPGKNRHGASFAEGAVGQGAAAVLTDPEGATQLASLGVPVLVTDHPREVLGRVSAEIYHRGVTLPKVLAVTGTNGKTSVAFYLEAICRALGHTTALSNSTERQVAGEVFRTPLTTPEAPELHALLAIAAERGVTEFALEASAQAIERHRLDGIVAEVSGFTNLSHDHFEDYGDMDNYLEHKLPLFQPEMSRQAVVSLESVWGKKVVSRSGVPVTTVADLGGEGADWTIDIVESSPTGQRFIVTGATGSIDTTISALGRHMVRNAALALVMVHQTGVSIDTLAKAVAPSSGGIPLIVPGRLERVSGTAEISVFVDAGRSADAYQKTFQALREVTPGRLIAICGTSGNRDRQKRPEMGRLAASLTDLLIVADDDPRFEDPTQIRTDLLEGARTVSGASIHEVAHPADAIRFAIAQAEPGDAIVWMGPGSQHYREIQGVRQPFSARDEARQALTEAGYAL